MRKTLLPAWLGCSLWGAGVSAFLVASPARAQTSADLAVVEQRLEAEFLASVPSTATVQSYQSTLLADGSWADVPYTNTAQTNWAPMTHLDRLGLMCRAYSHPSGSLYQNVTLLADILKAYDCWIAKNPQSSNWWYNQIAVPQDLGEAMVLIKEQLSSARLTSGLSVLQRAYVARSTNSGTNTGQNRVDRAIAGIQRGIVAGSVSITQDAFLAISDTILVTTAEGIQKDGSFHQHGAQLYNQGYGSLFISNTLKWAAKAADTGFAFSETQRRILTDYLLDGTRWMNRGQAIDYTASGRGLSRKSQSANGAGLGGLATTSLAVLPGYRVVELESLRSAINAANSSGSADPALAFSGGKHFWRGDYTAWHRSQGYAGVKISSTRTLQPESGNGEGLKNYHLGDGVNLILRTGNEYDDIMPVWNWRKLPGTTVEQGTYSLTPTADWGVAGTSTYAGGISDGTYAGTAFRYNRRNVAAKKAWFFFDRGFVALGSDIDAPAATAQVETTLNQSLLNGAVSYSTGGSAQTLASGSTTLGGLQWVHHDGTGYFFNQTPTSASIQAAAQTGTWQSINTGYDATSMSKNVFALSIRHGTAFSDGSYAYTVVPGLTAGEMAGFSNPITVLRNDATAQAARDASVNVTQAAFHAAGEVDLGGSGSVSADSACMVLLRPEAEGLRVSASSPEAKTMTAGVQFTGVSLGGGWMDAFGSNASVSVGLPGGDLAGSTAGLRLSSDGGADPTVSFSGTGGFTSLSASFGGPMILPGDTSLAADGMSLGFSGAISGAHALQKTGRATLTLSGANSYDGGTVVSGGITNVSNKQLGADGGWTIGSAATLATTVNFASGSAVKVRAGREFRIANNSASGTTTQVLNVAGAVSNEGSLYLGRPGVLNLNSGGGWLHQGPASINGHGGYRSEMTVNSGASFTYEGASSFGINPAPNNSGPAVLTVAGGTFSTSRGFANGTVSSSAAASVVLNGGGTLKLGADQPDLVTSAGSAFLFQLGTGGGKVNTNGFDAVMNAAISNVAAQTGSLTKSGSGTLTLTAANTYSGGTTVASGGGILKLTRPEAVGSGAISIPKSGTASGTLALAFSGQVVLGNAFGGFNSTTFAGDATVPTILHLSGDTKLTADLTISGMGGNGLYVRSDGGVLELAGTIRQTVGSIRLLGLGGTGEGIVSGPILEGTGGMGVVKDGAGRWTLAAANTYNAKTTINGGTLRITGTPGSEEILVNADGTLELDRSADLTVPNAISGTGRLVKSGSGKVVLTGTLARSGSTRVTAGVLELGSASLGDQAEVEIASGAVLALSHAAVDSIGALSFDGVMQAAGVWGAPGSGAAHESPRISGSGKLLVSGDPFERWLDGYPTLGNRSEDGDPDRDGWPNLLECALGLDPLLMNPPLATGIEGGKVFMQFQRLDEGNGVLVIPEWSDDLLEWSGAGLEMDESALPVVRVKMDLSGGQKFLRLRAVRE
ncbi:polysaccharide lyase family 8 super-sandwich domain-containing protein [Haloferula sp. BvORR071]|uniref:polysaccharide lyase family 8 super-sandwich domain-containing protein n=1 Tax=Haloferula sp. BvORR071 TaxID=1396141 RepID=UPI00224102E9|nr:polysaccharide lyase family 8 super-sandwich domain-containing protein [Haloferula sp. BvORR071]